MNKINFIPLRFHLQEIEFASAAVLKGFRLFPLRNKLFRQVDRQCCHRYRFLRLSLNPQFLP